MPPRVSSPALGPVARTLQCSAAVTAVALSVGLVTGAVAGQADERSGSTSAAVVETASSHHGGPITAAAGDAQVADPAPAAAGESAGALVAHDHGDLEVTVMLGEDGTTEVLGPVRSGAFISFVNHTATDQVLSTPDGALVVEVPLLRLVTVQMPTAPGTYPLTSRTDPTVGADLVVTADAGPDTAQQR